MKVLPIKLPDELYEDLKLLKKEENIAMADFIRQEIKKPLKNRVKKLKIECKKNKKQDPLEYMLNNPITAKDHLPHLTHDEILYGYTYDKRGKKVWPKKQKKS